MAFRDEMFVNMIPEIQRTNLANTVLLLKSLGVKDLLEFDFMDPPPQVRCHPLLSRTQTNAAFAGKYPQLDVPALGPRCARQHRRAHLPGTQMANFPMDPALAKMLIISVDRKCSAEVLTIVSMLSVPSVFYRPKERIEESDAAREKFVPESDHLTLLHVYTQWKSAGYVLSLGLVLRQI